MYLKYEIETGRWYDERYDKNESDYRICEYEVEWKRILPALIKIIYERHFKNVDGNEAEIKDSIENLICEVDGDSFEETYREELTAYFYDEAMRNFRE